MSDIKALNNINKALVKSVAREFDTVVDGIMRIISEDACPKCGFGIIWYHSKEDGISRAVCARKCTGWEVLKEIDRTKAQQGVENDGKL